jgi:hypothetical protein
MRNAVRRKCTEAHHAGSGVLATRQGWTHTLVVPYFLPLHCNAAFYSGDAAT